MNQLPISAFQYKKVQPRTLQARAPFYNPDIQPPDMLGQVHQAKLIL